MLMNCKRKIHEKLVFENVPQNPEAIKGIRAYLLALLFYATMSKRCENADFDLHIDIEGDETLFETEDESAGEIIQKLGNHGGFTIDITCSGKFVNIGNCSDEEFITVACFPDKVPSIFDCLENSGEKDFKYGKIAYFDGIDLWLSQYIDDKTCMDNVFDFGDIVEKKDFAISNLWNSEMFLVIAFDFEKYHDEAEEIKNIIERYIYVDDEKAQQEFMNIKYQNKLRLAKYIREHNGIDVDPRSIFDVQVKRLHEYKRQLLNILHVMYLYNKIKDHPEMPFYPRTFIFGAKAAAGYRRAKLTIKLINSVADVINNDKSINGKLKVVFIEDYRVSNAELIFSAADVSEQISTASKEASGTGNMKFMLNGALTIGTMDGANVEMAEEVGKDNMFIFGASADEIINLENNGGYNPMDIFNNDQDIRRVLMQLINGYYSPQDPELFRDIYNSLLNTQSSDRADTYFILKDFRSYAEAHKKIDQAYRDEKWWARTAMLNTASAGKFSSDRTIEEYAKEMWHLEKVTL